MFLWFLGLSVVIVWSVFQSPAIDYRRVMLGSVLPLVEAPFRVFVLHTLVASVVALALVMLLTQGRVLRRRAWIGIPIGMFLHLVLDAVWADAALFWWPFGGDGLGEAVVPERGRALPILLVMEAVGAMALVWAWGRFQLDDAEHRATFRRTGQMDRSVARMPDGGSQRSRR